MSGPKITNIKLSGTEAVPQTKLEDVKLARQLESADFEIPQSVDPALALMYAFRRLPSLNGSKAHRQNLCDLLASEQVDVENASQEIALSANALIESGRSHQLALERRENLAPTGPAELMDAGPCFVKFQTPQNISILLLKSENGLVISFEFGPAQYPIMKDVLLDLIELSNGRIDGLEAEFVRLSNDLEDL